MSTLLDTAISFALLAAVFWPLERLFPARPGQPWVRARWFTDLAFFSGQYLLWGGLVVLALDATHSALTSMMPARVPELISMQPRALQVIEVLFFADLGVYWFHRACHDFDFLWKFHAVHHSSEHLDWLAAHREHPLDGLCTQLVVNLPAFIMGFDLHTLGWAIALRGMWGLYIHSNARVPVGPLKYLLGAPELHHWHHARVERTAHNFANLAPWCDLLFGTYHCPEGAETYELGLTEEFPRSYLGQLVRPLLPREKVAEGRMRGNRPHLVSGLPSAHHPSPAASRHPLPWERDHSSPEPSPSCSPSFTESSVSH